MAPIFRPAFLLLAAYLITLPAAARAPADCQSPEETEAAAVLAKQGITMPGLALAGITRAPAAQGGEWLLTSWKPCLEPEKEPEGGVPTQVRLYHHPDGKPASLKGETELPGVLTYVTPAENPVLELADGPLALLEVATGGNCMTCEQLMPLRVEGTKLVAVEPPDPLVALREVTAVEPLPIITGYSAAFESYGPLCHACSPSTTVHLRLEKGKLLENCTAQRDDYTADVAAATAETREMAAAKETDDTAADELLSAAIAMLLDRLNGGVKPEEALSAFDSLTARATARATRRHGEDISAAAKALAAATRDAAAKGALNRGCPALGVKRPEGY
ncbi:MULTISPECIES: hypothetical protein [unclassified Azospirillum]|uniref:hypothetical protein n=1 Tax=unclassified Azospirillum TaxID=2630922 RepID=UPI000B672F42|nr:MULTISPECIES: hypothetical protein [unclassified Azospirillum]SNR83482.1 hypothetical protein SAMN05880556_10115 [Azospirillum sp. RU38E]SNR99006.1 hypothetical protein SAMN05880591_10115 [Azospirillum sp. RU37A]